MNVTTLLVVAAALLGVGLYGTLSQQSFVMLLMGVELMLNGVMLAAGGLWAYAGGGDPKGQLLVVIVLAVMGIEMAAGFALVVAVYRARQVDTTDSLDTLRH